MDSFDEVMEWYCKKYNTNKDQLSLREIVRLKKMASKIDSGEYIMEEMKINSLLEKENEKRV